MEVKVRGTIVLIDEEDAYLLKKYNWRIVDGRVATDVWIEDEQRRQRLLLHRVVLGLTPDDPCVDHKNGVTTDNQKHNLEISTTWRNGLNRKAINNTGTSRHLGVYWYEPKKRWIARRQINGHKRNFGSYKTEEEAIAAVIEGCKKFGVSSGY